MPDSTVNNKRIAKNTLMLYIRMGISMIVSLYTSRVVLSALGVEDYGIYGLVGGIVSTFSFLNSTMASATSRFLMFEMGKGNVSRIKATFSSAFLIHILIALIVAVLSETIGVWFLNNKLVIPENRMYAAHWVLQFSVLGMFVGFTQVPYNAAIIAHEKMNIYAFVELLNVFLKLAIVYLLSLCENDRLIVYAFLVLIVNVLIALTYRIYCKRNYEETKLSFVYDKGLLAPMFSYSSWEILGHLGFTFRTQGVSFVLNMFFGVIINAVTNIATIVQNTLLAFSNNVIIAIKPQIIKIYALGDYKAMCDLLLAGIKYNLLLMLILNLPLLFCTDFILNLWLKEVPEGCTGFCKILLICNIILAVSQIIYTGIQATGNVKRTNIFRNIIYIGTPLILYLLFSYFNCEPIIAYVLILLTQILMALIDILILKSLITEFDLKRVFSMLFKVCFTIILLSYTSCLILTFDCSSSLHFLLVLLNTIFTGSISFYCFVFNKTERESIKSTLLTYYHRIQNN